MMISGQSNPLGALENFLNTENESAQKSPDQPSVGNLSFRDTISISEEAKELAAREAARKLALEEEAQEEMTKQAGGAKGGCSGGGTDDSAEQLEDLEKALAKAQAELLALANSSSPEGIKDVRMATAQSNVSQIQQQINALKAESAKQSGTKA